ncbi:MAG TPA: Rrf2 family transcriptional regulator [Tepidisphaeraceae bacterium]|jgi:Rrf2 family protein|nr:Rrf2 family transcriptional regulator [Tepidisphaeraceae bacterium]
MLSLSKKTDYALIALSYLAERPERVASAREIAAARDLPAALLMNILKDLHHLGIVRSTRGSQGGYELAADPASISLHELIVAMQGPVKLVECAGAPGPCRHDNPIDADACRVSGHCAVQAPLQALHEKLVSFLQDVRLADVILSNSASRIIPPEVE